MADRDTGALAAGRGGRTISAGWFVAVMELGALSEPSCSMALV